ncbi:hypothetical protein MAP00_004231 [Monascus purpureus]|nr:hypothetical protein MAP00_004231 [Monascus purpureus]
MSSRSGESDSRPGMGEVCWDDGLILTAWAPAIAEVYTAWIYKLAYQRYHIHDIPPLSVERKVTGQKYNLANQLL